MNSHPDKNTLLLFLYEELPADELKAINEHTDRCEICQQEIIPLKETLNVYQQLSLDVPPQEIISNILAQKKDTAPSKSKLQSLVESLFSIQSRRWAIAAACGILLVAGGVYFLGLIPPPSKPSKPKINFIWENGLSDSLEVMSHRISLLKDTHIPISSAQTTIASTSAKTIGVEMSALKKRIKKFSKSLTSKTL